MAVTMSYQPSGLRLILDKQIKLSKGTKNKQESQDNTVLKKICMVLSILVVYFGAQSQNFTTTTKVNKE